MNLFELADRPVPFFGRPGGVIRRRNAISVGIGALSGHITETAFKSNPHQPFHNMITVAGWE